MTIANPMVLRVLHEIFVCFVPPTVVSPPPSHTHLKAVRLLCMRSALLCARQLCYIIANSTSPIRHRHASFIRILKHHALPESRNSKSTESRYIGRKKDTKKNIPTPPARCTSLILMRCTDDLDKLPAPRSASPHGVVIKGKGVQPEKARAFCFIFRPSGARAELGLWLELGRSVSCNVGG
jgi:hypothetical protein